MEHVSREVKVFWPQEEAWFRGVIDDYNPERGHHVQYDDGDDDWLLDLSDKGIQFVGQEDEEEREGEGGGAGYGEEEDEIREGEEGSEDGDERPYQRRGEGNLFEEKSEDFPFESSEFSSQELHENAILLKGEIAGANNLPIQTTDEGDGVFYRVLYVEGGSQSSMFRCKTPIYKSECSEDLEFPRWDEGLFRFEMVLPGDTPPMDFSHLGEVIVAIYRSRHNGGSDFVGQVTLRIQDFIRIGTVVRARQGCECRCLRGSYVLVDRKGDIMEVEADIEMNLRLEWKKRSVVEIPPKPSSSQRISSNVSVGGSSKRSTSTGRPKSANSIASRRSTSTGRGTQNPQTYRRERQLSQVAKENEAMRQRLEKIGPRSIHGTDRVGVIREAYRTPTTTSDPKRRTDSKPKGQVTSSSFAGDQESKAPTISSASLAKRSYSDLVSLFEDLRSKVARAQKELQNQRLAANKLKAQVEKHESLVERMKKAEIQSRKGIGASAQGSSQAVAERQSDESLACSYTVEDILLRNGLSENEDEISDQVLRELVVEHSALQQNRLSLKQRMKRADEKTAQAKKESIQLKKEIDEVSSIIRESVKSAPSVNWNLHQQHHPSKLQAMKSELDAAKDAKKLATICGTVHDDISNMITQISFLDDLIEKKKAIVEKIQYDAENWQAKLADLQEENLCGKMKTSINLMRGSIYRLRRQERLSEIKSETDAIELELLRHNLNHQMLLSGASKG